MKKYLFSVGGTKVEAWARLGLGPRYLIKGMVYEHRGEQLIDPDDPDDPVLVVYRPMTAVPVRAPRSEFIPIEEVPLLFDDDLHVPD
jgi:hypothetical protein